MNTKLSEGIIMASVLVLTLFGAVKYQAWAESFENTVLSYRVTKPAPDCPLEVQLTTRFNDVLTLTAKPGQCLTNPELFIGHVFEHGALRQQDYAPHHFAGYTFTVTRGTPV